MQMLQMCHKLTGFTVSQQSSEVTEKFVHVRVSRSKGFTSVQISEFLKNIK